MLGAERECGGCDRAGQQGVVGVALTEDDKFGGRERFWAGLGVAVDVGGEGLQGGDGQLVAVGLLVLDAAKLVPRTENDAAQLIAEGLAVELAGVAVG